jgi:hypothetical protein
MDSKEEKKPKYWYMIYEDECVLCGRHDIWRERQDTPKPEKWEDRHERTEYACDWHFL